MLRKFIPIIGILFVSLSAYPQQVVKLRTAEEPDTLKKEIPKEEIEKPVVISERVVINPPIKKSYPRINPSMLFVAPTAYVINSLAIQSVGGGTVSPEYEEQKRKFFLGIIGIGLGGIAELQINTLGVFNNLAGGSSNVPATLFKLRLLKESNKIPATAIMLKSSPVWNTQWSKEVGDETLPEEYEFMSKSATLYLIASKLITKDMTLHLGGNVSDYRLKTGNGEENQSAFLGPIVGFEKKVNQNTSLMGEYQRVPELQFSKEGEGKVNPIDLFIFGVRFFFIRIMSIDAGLTYASDYEGIADMILHTNITTTFSLSELYETLFKK